MAEPDERPGWAAPDAAVLPAAFYDGPVLTGAPRLLGCVISHAGVAIRLTETEAYDGANDPGSHAYRGLTPRTEVMFGPPGGLYVYFTYGMHFCANLVCGEQGRASAVLLRAGDVIEGHELARQRRGSARRRGPPPDRDLARGPARLTQALGLNRAHNGLRVTETPSPVTVQEPATAGPEHTVRTGPRVGVRGPGGDGAAYPWRFWLEGEVSVSTYRPAATRRGPVPPGHRR